MQDGVSMMDSDDFFAQKMREAGNVILPSTPLVTPPDLFTTNCLAVGDISTDKDSDGVLRRVKTFNRKWHPAFNSAARQYGFNLDTAVILPDHITLKANGNSDLVVPLNKDGDFDLTDFVGDQIPRGWKRYNKPYERVWDMGIVIAAQELHLDLDHAVVDLPHGQIRLQGPGGVERRLPVDADGYFYIDWRITPDNTNRLVRAPIEDVLRADMARLSGETNQLRDPFRGKLVVVGSAATGNDLTDHGATPLENDTLLVSSHWNVANSIITGEFVRRTTLPADLLIIGVFGLLTALLTWQLRAIAASFSVALLMAAYGAMAFWIFRPFSPVVADGLSAGWDDVDPARHIAGAFGGV